MGTGAGTGAGSGAGSGASSCQWSSALPPTQMGTSAGTFAGSGTTIGHQRYFSLKWVQVLVLVPALVLVLVPAAVNGHQLCLPLKTIPTDGRPFLASL